MGRLLRRSMVEPVVGCWRLLHRNILRAHRTRVSRQSGFALVVVLITVAVLGAVVSEFGYNARVEYEAAANARDMLKAEYLARSGINLSRILIKVQTGVVDNINKMMKTDFQIIDFAPFLLQAFGGSDEEAAGLGALIGVDTSSVTGLGAGKGQRFDVVMGVEDGKINVNCGGGFSTMAPVKGKVGPGQMLYNMLNALMVSPRYNRMFETPTADGQYVTRDDVASAIIDWSDIDEQHFNGLGTSGNASEDYHYDDSRDPYKAHNNYYDTVEEVNLVRGVGDDWWGSFGEMLTVYGNCQVNLRAANNNSWIIHEGVIRGSASNPQDQALMDPSGMTVSMIAYNMAGLMALPMFIQTSADYIAAVKNGGRPDLTKIPKELLTFVEPMIMAMAPFQVPGLALDQTKFDSLARLGNASGPPPREIYRLDSTGMVDRVGDKKVRVHIRAIFDTKHVNANTLSADINDKVGTWVYWRME